MKLPLIAVLMPMLAYAQHWTKKADIPGAGRFKAMSFAINNKIYVGGGYIGSSASQKDLQEYDPATNKWTAKKDLPGGFSSRSAGITFTIAGKVYLGLGAENYFSVTTNPKFLTDLWEYNPSSDSWTKMTDLPDTGRADAAVFVVNNKAYVVGGYTGSFATSIFYSNDCWEYDPATNKWTAKAAFPDINIRSAVALVLGAKVM